MKYYIEFDVEKLSLLDVRTDANGNQVLMFSDLNNTNRSFELIPFKSQPSGDTIKLLKGIIDSYTNSPKGIFCKEVPITEQEIEAIKYVYNILKEGEVE